MVIVPEIISILHTILASTLNGLLNNEACFKGDSIEDQTLTAWFDSFADSCGVSWGVIEVDGGHEAFMTRPEDVAEVIINSAQMWRHE